MILDSIDLIIPDSFIIAAMNFLKNMVPFKRVSVKLKPEYPAGKVFVAKQIPYNYEGFVL